jgi:ribosome recycling factor
MIMRRCVMLVELTEEEREALVRLVEREISDLGPEIRHTMTSSFRDDLKLQKRTLRRFLERLRAEHVIP